jgi:hypothetical protein
LWGYPISTFHAANDSVPNISLDESKEVLSIAGAVIDIVESSSKAFSYKSQFPLNDTRRFIKNLWTQQCGFPEITLANEYVNHESSLAAFLQTLSAGCLLTAVHEIWAKKSGVERQEFRDRCLADGAAWFTERGVRNIKVDPAVLEASSSGNSSDWRRNAASATSHRKFARTSNGYYSLCSSIVEAGDFIVIFFGGKTPYCIRPRADSFVFLGECYVHGLMHGEAMTMLKEGVIAQQTFKLV